MSCLQTMTSPLNKLSCNTDKDIYISNSVPGTLYPFRVPGKF